MTTISRLSPDCELLDASATDGLVPGIIDRPFRAPDGVVAVQDAEQQLSYTELIGHADGIAAHLRTLGVRPGTIVGIYLPRSAAAVVAILAVLRAGGAYLPLDPRYPAERIRFMLDDSQAPFIITNHALRGQIPSDRHAICVDSPATFPFAPSTDPLVPHGEISQDTLAYIVYTSGSTGTPKGIEMPRGPLAEMLAWQRVNRCLPRPRTCQFAPLSFDVSFLEIFTTLDQRGTLVIAPDEVRDDGAALLQFLLDTRIERLIISPVALQYLATAAQSRPLDGLAVREVITMGEQILITPAIREFFVRTGCVLDNQYGPSETHVVTSFRLTGPAADWPELPPIGAPFNHVHTTIVDGDGRPVAPGEEGELLLSGPCLARGYLRRPELTAERFSYEFEQGVRHYRTGDQVRELATGELVYMGRLDQQVKINGFRVELGEVEAVIARHPSIAQVAATTVVTGAGIRRLVAYVVFGPHMPAAPEEIRRHARATLPEYAVPTVVVPLPGLPKTPNGKVDRKSLPPPWLARAENAGYVAASTPLQRQLVEIWEFVLGISQIGITDDLVALGVDSLAVMQLAARLERRLGSTVEPVLLYRHRTIADLADAIEQRTFEVPTAQPTVTPARPTTSPSFVRQYARPLDEMIRGGALPRLDAAALSYLPSLDPERRARCWDWHHGHPVLTHLIQTTYGTIGLFCLPIEAPDLYTGPKRELVAASVEAIRAASDIGAQAIALTGLLASALDYGRDLVELAGQNDELHGIRLTTGHATTIAAVVMNTEQLFIVTGRTLERERVACVGLGSIGRSALLLMLDQLPHPAQLTLCDTSPTLLDRVASEVTAAGYRGRLVIAPAVAGSAPAEVYDASFIVGATSSAAAVEVQSIQAGTLVLDDSWPRSFDNEAAVARMTESADMIAAEAGELYSPTPVEVVGYVPDEEFAPLLTREELIAVRGNPHEIMGCVSAGLFVTAWGLPTTIGLVSTEVARQHYRTLRKHGYRGTSPHLTGHLIAPATLSQFRHRYSAGTLVPGGPGPHPR
jgi:amino acid adenylation domain-containing protein